jgi:hypothetical protein
LRELRNRTPKAQKQGRLVEQGLARAFEHEHVEPRTARAWGDMWKDF